MRGRKPIPTAKKILAGNPGHRPLNFAEPQPVPGKLECPQELSALAKAEWARIVPLFDHDLLAPIDRAALAAYCTAYARFVTAEKKLQRFGAVIAHEGYPMQSPYVSICNKAMDQMRAFMTELGMTPSSRTRISLKKRERTDEDARFLDAPLSKASEFVQ